MKKLISILLVIVLIFTLSACSNDNADNTSNTETDVTESIIENTKDSDDKNNTTHSDVTTEKVDDSETQKENDTTENEENKNTEHETTNTTAKDDVDSNKKTENNKTDTNNKNQNDNVSTTKPESDKTDDTVKEEIKVEEKPYYIGYELISIERPTTTYKVNGVPLLEKAYGTKFVLQVGDTATFKINMSDGGSNGFSLRYKESCDVTIVGNLLKITANAGYSEKTDVDINVDTKDGVKAIQLPRFINTKETIDYTENSMAMQVNIFWEYAVRKGLINTNLGIDLFEEIKERKIIEAANNPCWITEGFCMIDNWVNKGYTKFALIVDVSDGMSGSGGY